MHPFADHAVRLGAEEHSGDGKDPPHMTVDALERKIKDNLLVSSSLDQVKGFLVRRKIDFIYDSSSKSRPRGPMAICYDLPTRADWTSSP